MLRMWVASTLLAAAFAAGTVPDERVVVIEPFGTVPFNSEISVTISGWPEACPDVDVDFVDGDAVEPGEVLAHAGTFELSNGATQVTIPTPAPAEYNLRVSGADPECGEPYFSPDFFVSGSGDIDDIDVDDDHETATLTASNWSPNCPSLDVTWHGPWAEEGSFEEEPVELPGIEPAAWPWEAIALTDGFGTATGPLPLVLDVRSYWTVTIAGDPEQCGYPRHREIWLDEALASPPITVVTAPGPTVPSPPAAPVLSASARCDGDDGVIDVTIHDPELGSYTVNIRSEQYDFTRLVVDVTEPTPIVYSFGPIPDDRYSIVVDDEFTEALITSVTVSCLSETSTSATSTTATSTTAMPTSTSRRSAAVTLPTTGSSGRTDTSLIATALLLVTTGSVLLVARRR